MERSYAGLRIDNLIMLEPKPVKVTLKPTVATVGRIAYFWDTGVLLSRKILASFEFSSSTGRDIPREGCESMRDL